MDDILQKNSEAKPTGRRYSSVGDLVRDELFAEETQTALKKLAGETRITRLLASLRAKAGMTQAELGELISKSQSAISKLESGSDEDLTLGEIRDYAKALNERVAMMFGPAMTHTEAIRLHALALKQRLLELAQLAHQDVELEREINRFFDEAVFNILQILVGTVNALPNGSAGITVQVIDSPRASKPVARRSDERPQECCI